MNVLKEVAGIQLNEGGSMAKGLYNLSREVNEEVEVSFWFDGDTKDRLINLSDAEFFHQANEMIKESY
jgi:hypothetical protein